MSHTNDIHDMYPSPRKVLRGNGHVANLRCAVKYTLWMGVYVLLAALVGIGRGLKALYWGVVEPFLLVTWERAIEPVGRRVVNWLDRREAGLLSRLLSRGLEWLGERLVSGYERLRVGLPRAFNKFCHHVINGFRNLANSRVGSIAYVVASIIALPFVIVLLALEEVDKRTGIFTGTGNVLLFAAETTVVFGVGAGKQVGACSKSGGERFARGVKEKTQEMQDRPGTRRIYGMCPVTFSQRPKWFDNVFGLDHDSGFEDLFEKGSEDDAWSEEDVDDFMSTVDEEIEPNIGATFQGKDVDESDEEVVRSDGS